MLTVDAVLQKVEAYQCERMSLSQFDQWFEDYAPEPNEVAELEPLRLAIQAAFAQYYFDSIGEAQFRKELAAAIRPFAKGVLSLPEWTASSASVIELSPRPQMGPKSSLALVAASVGLISMTLSDAPRSKAIVKPGSLTVRSERTPF